MSVPGYYKTVYRAASVQELVRVGGLVRLPLTFFLSRFVMRPKGASWMPSLSTDRSCAAQELSESFWRATETQRSSFSDLGFTECLFSKVKYHLNPMFLDTGGITYLHSNRAHIGLLIYGKLRVPRPINSIREHITISFVATFDKGCLTFSNTKEHFDPMPNTKKVLVTSDSPARIYRRFVDCLQREGRRPRVFPSGESALQWLDAASLEAFESRVQRGLFVKMSDEEVEQARGKMM
ncbi:MAG TPA: hypothetical protein VLZ30_02035 [Verrucomicrobiae bacterium]|nr:hypothetical protein [Verrucomicrobiae bacterium]